MVRKIASLAMGLVIFAAIVAGVVQLIRRPHAQLTRVKIGSRDEVYYYHSATKEDAAALGDALRKTGFLNDRGTTVILSKGTAGTSVSFALNDGAWDHPDTVYTFEEIGRRIAGSIGGFPIKVRLIDSRRVLHKELNVGKIAVGTRDAIYYFGSATEADAAALGDALRAAGYFRDLGAAVVLSRDGETSIAFVVDDGVWNQPAAVSGFQQLVRQIAPRTGGLPIQLRLLDADMTPRRTVNIQ